MQLTFTKDERKKYYGFDDMGFFLLGIPIVGFLVAVMFFYDFELSFSQNRFMIIWISSLIHTTVYWIGVRIAVFNIRKKYNSFSDTRKRIIREFLFLIIYVGIAGLIINLTLSNFLFHYKNEGPKGLFASYFTAAFILTIYEANYLYAQNKKQILLQEKQKREHIKSELQGLRNQVNPHFLFNSMNTLMNIIHEDQDLAASFLKKLSKVYRYILESRDDFLIPFGKELEFIQSYVFLQKERFKNNLEVQIEVADHLLDKKILPLTLQLLFENAIKHNVISSKYPLHINVYVEEGDVLVIKNNLKRRPQAMPSTGVGLENIRSRLKYFTKVEIEVQETTESFIVKIPLLSEHQLNMVS